MQVDNGIRCCLALFGVGPDYRLLHAWLYTLDPAFGLFEIDIEIIGQCDLANGFVEFDTRSKTVSHCDYDKSK